MDHVPTPYVGGNAVYTARVMLDIDPLNHGLAYREGKEPAVANELQMLLYPNPANDYLMVELMGIEEEINATLAIYDLQGRIVRNEIKPLSNRSARIELDGIKPGLFLIRLTLADGRQVSSKFIKKQ